jgi:putative hemolysin
MMMLLILSCLFMSSQCFEPFHLFHKIYNDSKKMIQSYEMVNKTNHSCNDLPIIENKMFSETPSIMGNVNIEEAYSFDVKKNIYLFIDL